MKWQEANKFSRGVWKRVRRDPILGIARKTLMKTKWAFRKRLSKMDIPGTKQDVYPRATCRSME
jgi:hypothetical protein